MGGVISASLHLLWSPKQPVDLASSRIGGMDAPLPVLLLFYILYYFVMLLYLLYQIRPLTRSCCIRSPLSS
jgi:hypothetical protein